MNKMNIRKEATVWSCQVTYISMVQYRVTDTSSLTMITALKRGGGE
jgi:hypothetical protein